jgi:molybdopterin-guanine dinucleotide biosynthesis protein B
LVDLIEQRSHDIVDTLFANNCGFNNGEAIAKEIRNGNLSVENLDDVCSYLSIDGKVVGLNRFVSDYLKQSVLGVINTLNLEGYGVSDIGKIELIIPDSTAQPAQNDKKATILINDERLEINQFTNNIVANSISAMVNSLKTEYAVETIDIEISNIINENLVDADIILETNSKPVEINKFTCGILKETVFAVISTLKIDGEINNIKVNVVE